MSKETCIACDEPFKDGDRYYWDVSGGFIHADCCSDDPESYVDEDCEPLGPSDAIPEPQIWSATPSTKPREGR